MHRADDNEDEDVEMAEPDDDIAPAPKPKAPKAKEEKQISEQPDARDPASNADGHARESSDESGTKRDKKRKVTFNVQPNVVTIKREVKDEDDEPLPERADGKITQF